MPTIAIGHPYLGRGGSEARVMWLIQALRRDYKLSVVTTGGWDLADLNATYRTQVVPHDVDVRLAPFPRFLKAHVASALRYSYYQRYCRSIASQFDLCISAYNCTDWGREAIQFIADLAWSRDITTKATGTSPGFAYRDTYLRRMYLAWSRHVLCPSGRDPLREDLLLPTSQWGESMLRERYGVSRVRALYPFLHSPAQNCVDRERLCNDVIPFLCLGRIAPEKRIEDAIAILIEVRRRGFPVRLIVAGGSDSDLYGRRIARLCRENAEWVQSTGRVRAAEKERLFNSVAFGISTCRQELFGNAVAEMMCGGIIPFVHSQGGPAEIVNHQLLTFDNHDQGVARIIEVLENRDLRRGLREHVLEASTRFSLEKTIAEVQSIVSSALAGTPKHQWSQLCGTAAHS